MATWAVRERWPKPPGGITGSSPGTVPVMAAKGTSTGHGPPSPRRLSRRARTCSSTVLPSPLHSPWAVMGYGRTAVMRGIVVSI
jgi:hypothetical protein